MIGTLVNISKIIIQKRELIWQMSKRDVMGRYKGSFLGLAWSLFNPILMLTVYTFVFSVIFKSRWGSSPDAGHADFAIILFTGLIIFNLFAECINRSTSLITSNVNFVKKVVFPIEILPIVNLLAALFHASISLIVLFIAILVFKHQLHFTVLLLPVITIPLMLSILGLSWILASLGVFVRDIPQTISIIVTILMFLSPVFYPLSALPVVFQKIVMLNPLAFMIEEARKVVYWGNEPNWTMLAINMLIGLVICAAGFLFFQKQKKDLPMSSDNIAISVSNISKCYNIYQNPRDRLKQFFLPKVQSMVGKPVQRYYNEFWALNNINFTINKGESAGIIGRNGSGKSTLLQLITGTLTPTTGTIQTKGRIAALLELGSGFNPEFTGRENIYLNGAVLGLSRAEIDAKFDAIAGFADIGTHLDQPVKTYSSGMMVRLAFAVQVQLEPDILIVDEALAVGDALFQKRCFQQIEKLTSNGVTLLFVSHDQESVRTLTNRAILLDRGTQLSTGLSSEVLLEYRRLLHREESKYFSQLAEEVAAHADATRDINQTPTAPAKIEISANAETPAVEETSPSRTDKLSFGEGEAEVENVELFTASGERSNAFNPGDKIRVRVNCKVNKDINHINVGIRIRNKEGVKIYSWGTLNQDMYVRFHQLKDPQFWEREFKAGERFYVDMEFECTLGTNLYEIQAAISYEGTPNYFSQRILHWRDEAAFFHVNVLRDEYFFGGILDLKMTAEW